MRSNNLIEARRTVLFILHSDGFLDYSFVGVGKNKNFSQQEKLFKEDCPNQILFILKAGMTN